ncbi:hypothetical protein ABID21_000456 [Pseudorhizobium tarimense]|uniref:Transposase IS701-like DDE domain-containing protein n=1 Tax=Pseudorhizobium tarimense TaxID=1079109 RepID=A0ABV2H1N8_9HYPH
MDRNWHADLERWLTPFSTALQHKTRARMCPAYIAGLIGPADRNSIQPMAARDGDVSYVIGSGVWDVAPLEAALLVEADKLVGDQSAWLIIDDTALPKKGRHSVGVAPQYASALGKTADCQSLISVSLASREVPVMVGLRLFLPETWTDDPERMVRARAEGSTGRFDKAGDRPRGDRSGYRLWHALRLLACRLRIWIKRAVPSGFERAWPQVGGGAVAPPKRLHDRPCDARTAKCFSQKQSNLKCQSSASLP